MTKAPQKVRMIDMTPTWPEALRMLRAVIENGTSEGQALAWTEIERMAEIAQQQVDQTKASAQPKEESQ